MELHCHGLWKTIFAIGDMYMYVYSIYIYVYIYVYLYIYIFWCHDVPC